MKAHIDNIEIYYEIEKPIIDNIASSTILLLHGGPGIDHSYFKPEMSALTDEFRLIYLDHRGHGRSDRSSPEKWNLNQWTDDVCSFLDCLKIDKLTILGHSFGGFVAQKFALKYPERVDKLILSSTMATLNIERIVYGFKKLYGSKAKDAAQNFWNNPSNLEARIQYEAVCKPLYNTSFDPKKPVKRKIIKNEDVLLHFYGLGGEGRTFDLRDNLKRLAVPTLILAGENDPVSTPEHVQELLDFIPPNLVNLLMLEGCGHGIFRDSHELVISAIKDFVRHDRIESDM